MKSKFILLAILFFTLKIYSQQSASTYQSKANKNYWKNKKPYEGYWQQDVSYKIKASLDDSTDIITGNSELTYTNNSPDELTFVYFHLYSNAQVKDSYLSDLYTNNRVKVNYGKYQEQGLGTNVLKITSNSVELESELDNTILKVYLTKPLKSGESITFNIDFKTYFDNGTIRNRMKLFNAWNYKHYDVVHWYPRIAVYDRKFGWNTDQHLDHEFYGNFGSYDVSFTLPNNYIADATGTLLNESEVLPTELKNKLNITNFANKPWNEEPSVIITPNGTKKTWHYYAENVHDFALTTDPTYRIGEAEWKGIKCIALVQEPHASRWQNAAEYTAQIIKTHSESFGMYEYPKMIVADARDGMEYPMLTLDGGYDPDYRDLLIHEVGHNWFFGMIGSNETYRASLDEGFTQFMTAWTYNLIDGDKRIKIPYKYNYVQKHQEPDYIINSEVYTGYMYDAIAGEETNINVHSDGYNGALRHGGGYRQVYFKTATMLYNLQYTLGDSLFLAAMQHYVSQWKFAHPYVEDFRNSIIEFTHVDLNWFFDQWLETSKTIDYKVKSVKKTKEKDSYNITFERKGMQMPIDFTVISKADSSYYFHIPNNWFEKETPAIVLPRWIGWDKIKPKYTANVHIPDGIKNVIIDTTNRLADVYMLDNSYKLPIKYRIDSKIYSTPVWNKYEVYSRPDIWYNGYDGIKIGLNMNSNFMQYKHIVDASVWLNMGLAQSYLNNTVDKTGYDNINFRASYKTATDKFMKKSSLFISAKALDGLNGYTIGFDKKDAKENNRYYINFKSMYRSEYNDLMYLLLPQEWSANKLNNTLNIGVEHAYKYTKGKGDLHLGMRTSALMSDYDYQTIHLTAINKTNISKLVLNTRVFGQFGTGLNWAKESSLFLAGANPEELMENKYTRSIGFVDPTWASISTQTNYFQQGGGLNLRGYAGYLAPQTQSDGTTTFTYKGQTGVALNTELEFSGFFKIKKQNFLTRTFKLTTYLFGDAGIINYNKTTDDVLKMSDLRVDAGLGTTLTIQRFGVLQTVKPLVIRFDMPFFLNRIPPTETEYFKFRFVVGISRAF